LPKYNKKRARELKHDRFRDATMLLADRLADRVAGHRQQILYGVIGIIVVAIGVYAIVRWRNKHADEAAAAMGRAIAINDAEIGASAPPGSRDPFFTSQQERSERAIQEFEKIAAKYGEPYRTEARYFIATNELVTDRLKAETDLQNLTGGSGDVAVLAKYALAQAKESDGNLDQAAALYSQIASANSQVVTTDSANLRLAVVYGKQGKKKEASDLLFNLISAARNAKDKDGKPIPESGAAREAAQELLKIDPDRNAQLPAPPAPLGMF
jgi:tetratricopeptide (TPR) repeat protein